MVTGMSVLHLDIQKVYYILCNEGGRSFCYFSSRAFHSKPEMRSTLPGSACKTVALYDKPERLGQLSFFREPSR